MIKICRNLAVILTALSMTACGKIVPNTENIGGIVTTAITNDTTDTTTTSQTTTAENATTKAMTTAKATLTTVLKTTVSSSAAAAPQTTAAATVAATAAPQTTAATTAAATAAPETTVTTEAATEPATTQPPTTYTVEERKLLLANKTHNIGDYEPPELAAMYDGAYVDRCVVDDLQNMYTDMINAGLSPYTREGYRTYEDQQEVWDTRVDYYLSWGYSNEGAVAETEKYVAVPGTSEHQLGLAVDINAADGNEWGVYYWLSVHAHEYGFILRYPQGKEYITGYEYEPWHYRYVGEYAATYMYNNGLTLEEYLGVY